MSFLKSNQLKNEIFNFFDDCEFNILTPFIKLDGLFFDGLDFGSMAENMRIITRYDSSIEEKYSNLQYLEYMGAGIKFIDNLHSKIYISEKRAIVSSLNLYDYSFDNNIECGSVYYRGSEDYDNIYDYYNFLWENVSKSKKNHNLAKRN